MEQLYDYRARLLERYRAAAREFQRAVISAVKSSPHQKEGEWSIHQLAAHTRDVEKMVYGVRIRRTLGEENPLFENFDGDAWMAQHYRTDEPVESILKELMESVEEAAAQLAGIPPAAWARPSRHATYGNDFTLQTWVERGLAHIEEHLKSVTG